MPGHPNATLAGHAIPTVAFPFWDHTFVTSSCGLVWSCFGNTTYPNPICQNQGDSSIANCLSKPNGTAGLTYFVNGVCHQASNRILHPAGIDVRAARGYGLSLFRYGIYGKNLPSPALSACYPPGPGTAPASSGPSGPSASGQAASRTTKAFGNSTELEGSSLDKHPERISELYSLVQSTPGLKLEASVFLQLSKIQEILWSVEDELFLNFQAKRITASTFYDMTMEATRIAMHSAHRLMGDRFFLLFGEAGLKPECMMDREVFIHMQNVQGDVRSNGLPYDG